VVGEMADVEEQQAKLLSVQFYRVPTSDHSDVAII
jgi:hypothetical protein